MHGLSEVIWLLFPSPCSGEPYTRPAAITRCDYSVWKRTLHATIFNYFHCRYSFESWILHLSSIPSVLMPIHHHYHHNWSSPNIIKFLAATCSCTVDTLCQRDLVYESLVLQATHLKIVTLDTYKYSNW